MVGQSVMIRPVGGQWERGLISDCSGHSATSAWMRRNGIVAEIDGATAKRWGVVGRGAKVEIAVQSLSYPKE